MNEVAQHFLETYARGGEVDGGWKFSKALQQARLDYSEQSLDRLDQLIAAIRERVKPSREVLQETLQGRNFCSLIGHKIFGLKETQPSDPSLAAIAQLVSDEMDRSMGFKLPPVFSSKDMRAAAFMVFRQHIPNGVLSAGSFPLLTHPSTDAVMVVPFEFWPIEMIILWKAEKL